MSQISYFKTQPVLVTLGESWRGKPGNLGKHLEWRDRDETWWVE